MGISEDAVEYVDSDELPMGISQEAEDYVHVDTGSHEHLTSGRG